MLSLEEASQMWKDKQMEKDPYGKQDKEPGSKLDYGKIDVTRGCLHYFPRALRSVAELSEIGAKKYSWKGWESVPDGIHRYGAALGRHELCIEGDYTRRDRDTGVLEATAVAWNALARLELILREQEKQTENIKIGWEGHKAFFESVYPTEKNGN